MHKDEMRDKAKGGGDGEGACWFFLSSPISKHTREISVLENLAEQRLISY